MADKTPKKDLTREEWIARYGSDTQYYTHNLNKVDLTTGKTIQALVNEAAKKHNIDPAFLASTLFSEGLDRYNVFKDEYGSKREDFNEFAVSGMKHLGLDTIGNRKNELFKKGYIDPKEYKANVYESNTKNEKGEDVISADFKDLGVAINYVAAFQRNENDILDNHLKKNNIELSPLQKTFFQNVAYNAGAGNAQKMVSSYNQKGYLKDDKAIFSRPDDYWKEVHKHAHKRTTAGAGLKEQKDLPTLQGSVNPYQFKEREEAQVSSELTPKGLSADLPTLTRAEEKSLPSFATEGIVGKSSAPSATTGKPSLKEVPRSKTQVASDISASGLASGQNDLVKATANIPLKEVSRSKTKSASTIKSTAMATKNSVPEISEESKKRMVDNLMAGIPGVESAKDGYSARNTDHPLPEMQALGKYQFVPKHHWDKITAFADKNGYNVKTYQDFLDTPSLQDAFMRNHVETVLIPGALRTLAEDKNPLDLSIETVAMLGHFQGEAGAKKIVTTGKHREKQVKGVNGSKVNNISSDVYVDKYKGVLASKGIAPVRNIETMTDAEKMEIGKIYHDKVDNIIHGSADLNEKEKNARIQEIQTEFKAEGLIPAVNFYSEKRTEQNASEAKKKDDKIRENTAEFQKWGEKTRLNDGKGVKQASITLGGPDEAKEFKAWAKKNGVKVSGGTNFIFNVDAQNFKLAGVKALTGKEDLTKEQIERINKAAGGEDGEVVVNQLGNKSFENTFRKVASWFTGETPQQSGSMMFDDEALNYAKNLNTATTIQALDESIIPDRPTPPPSEETATATDTTKTAETVKETGTDAKGLAGDDTPEGESLLDQWGKNLKEDIARKDAEGEGNSYNKKDFKKEIPYDAIMGMALGIKGLNQAKDTKVPKRTEEVSEAYKNFASELAKKSKQGLPPAVEAAMKAQLAEGLQGGLANIVNASNGNRALVLGNLGGLEKVKAQGIVDMQLADYEAKERAFAQYGEAIKYQNDFNTRRDVANHAIDYQEALKRRSDGEDLANAGFAQMIEGLKYQKENGPGSINHMKKSWLEQEMFGFAMDAKADAPNSYEAQQKRKAELKDYKGLQLDADEKRASLNPQQQEVMNKFLETNPSERDGMAMVNYLHENPSKVRMDPSRFAEAKERQDFGLMFSDEEKPITEISKPEKIVSPAIAQLEAMRPTGMPGRATQKPISLQPNGIQGLSSLGNDTFTPRSPEQSGESMANLEEPEDFEFALGQANDNQLSYYNKQ